MGRIDDQFSCGGENIYPKEVELLLVQHPDIIDAVVMPIAHNVKGLAPAALVTVRTDQNPQKNPSKPSRWNMAQHMHIRAEYSLSMRFQSAVLEKSTDQRQKK